MTALHDRQANCFFAFRIRGENGRGGGTRTHDNRFWRPVLYQLSYTPAEELNIMPSDISVQAEFTTRPRSAGSGRRPNEASFRSLAPISRKAP